MKRFIASLVSIALLFLPATLEAQSRGLRNFSCLVAVSTATTITAVGGGCATPGAGYVLNITDVSFGSSAASGTAADSFPTIKSGTGGTCETATTVVWHALSEANTTVSEHLQTPIALTAAHELCWIMSTAGSKVVRISGFVTQS